jgi:hypothetical protein
MILLVESVILQVEGVLRGGSIIDQLCYEKLKTESLTLLKHYSSRDAIEEFESCDHEQKAKMLALAVKLHNKARNLTNLAYISIRTYLKASAGWILSLYGGDNVKVLTSVITLLSKAGHELSSCEGQSEMAIVCLMGSKAFWNRAVSLSIQKDLAPIPYQEIRISTFWANIELASLLWKLKRPQEEIRLSVLAAQEMIQTLPARIKLTFAERVLGLGRELSNEKDLLGIAKDYIQTALRAIEAAVLPNLGDNADTEDENLMIRKSPEVKKLKLNAQLSLAFLHMETK